MAERKKILNIVVVGGSLGGLFTAIVLKRLGHHIRILERTPTALLHNQGAGIVLGGPSQDFFHKHDRTKSPLAVSSHTRQYLNHNGDVIDQENTRQEMTSWDLLYNVLRRNYDGAGEEAYFRNAKEESIEDMDKAKGKGMKAEYLYGHIVTLLKDFGSDGVEVEYQDKDGKGGSLTADLVIGADGPSSTVRKILQPEVERTYAGYVAWRGTVLESEVSEETRQCFVEKFTFFHKEGLQILAYLIPGSNGTLQPGQRLLNYVWYCNYPSSSQEYKDLMTDSSGIQHRWTLPVGKVSPTVWTNQQNYATDVLPKQFSELVQKTKHSFVQVITDVISPHGVYMDGKLILVGDAMCGLRPHTAASTSQAAMHALGLEDVMSGKMELPDWEKKMEEWAEWMSGRGQMMGNRSQLGSIL